MIYSFVIIDNLKVLKLFPVAAVATDCIDGNGLKFEKNWPICFKF